MSDTVERLREELRDPELSEGYAESFLDSYIATQIKVLREQAGLSQRGLAELIGTRQGVVSRIENVNYSKWNLSTLKKLGRAFRVRVKVSFETYGSLLTEVATFSRESLQREPRECDSVLNATLAITLVGSPPNGSHSTKSHQHSQLHSMTYQSVIENRNRPFIGAAAQLSGHTTVAEMAQRN